MWIRGRVVGEDLRLRIASLSFLFGYCDAHIFVFGT